jgi:hypothetical protein
LVRVDGDQLRQGNRKVPALPADQHEHFVGAGILGRHTPYFNNFPFPEGRDGAPPRAIVQPRRAAYSRRTRIGTTEVDENISDGRHRCPQEDRGCGDFAERAAKPFDD